MEDGQYGQDMGQPSLSPALPSGRGWRDFPGALSSWWSRHFPGPPPAPECKTSRLWGLLLMVVAALVLFPRLNQPLLDPDEGRQAEVPREMLVYRDFLVP